MKTSQAIDLTRQPPRSPRERVGGYAIFGRTIDKCRADLAGQIGEYHFDCPLDNVLFDFKGVTGADLREQVEKGLDEEALVEWLSSHGSSRTPDEIQKWSDDLDRYSMMEDPEKREFFSEECRKLGLDPEKTTMFEWLEADDRASFSGG